MKKSSGEWTSRQKKRRKKDRKSNRVRQKNKRADSKVDSNDSPEIPDRGETSDIPGPPFGGHYDNNDDDNDSILMTMPIRNQCQQHDVRETERIMKIIRERERQTDRGRENCSRA